MRNPKSLKTFQSNMSTKGNFEPGFIKFLEIYANHCIFN